jgi:hypothetical protein
MRRKQKKTPKNGSDETRTQKVQEDEKKKRQSEEKWPQKVKGNMNPNGRNFLC